MTRPRHDTKALPTRALRRIMTISDQSRHRLHQRLDELLGADEAATLMEHLPPVGWADVATTRDLDHLAHELRSEIRTGAAEVRAELHREVGAVRGQLQTLFLGLVGLQITAAGLAITLSRVL